MSSLQKTLNYEGDLSKLDKFPELKKIEINFEVPVFSYDNQSTGTVDTDGAEILSISQFSYPDLKKEFALLQNGYSIKVPSQNFFGNDANLFLRFLSENGADREISSMLNKLIFTVSANIKNNVAQQLNVLVLIPFDFTDNMKVNRGQFGALPAMRREQPRVSNKTNIQKTFDKLVRTSCFVNKDVFENSLKELTSNNIKSELVIFFLYNSFTTNSFSLPKFEPVNKDKFDSYKTSNQIENNENSFEKLIEYFSEHFDSLFDFPLSVPEIIPIEVKGDIKFISPTAEVASNADLINYDLYLDYTDYEAETQISVKYKWENFSNKVPLTDNKKAFNFHENNQVTLDSSKISDVTVTLKISDGTFLQSQIFEKEDIVGMEAIHFTVDLYKLPEFESDSTGIIDKSNQQLKGKVIELSGKCSLADLTVLIQAKSKETDVLWKVVASATTDKGGNFMMKYPFGIFEKAQALISLTPDSPVDIPTFNDKTHQEANQTISNDFLFLMLENANCQPVDETKPDDCGCHSDKKTPRLPNQEDLINSGEFSQDLGGGTCVNLTTPNRTLSETSHYAIVRTSEPDVANYRLVKDTISDSSDPTNFDKNKVTFALTDEHQIVRKPISLSNPIRWQDAPDDHDNLTIYQAVQVAHGHLLTYKTSWKADGYSLGDLLYSLPLAPGQKKLIVVTELKHSLQGSETQRISQNEGLNASITNDRTILNSLNGGIREQLSGRSSASTGGISAGLGLGFMGSAISGVLGVSGGYSNSNSSANQESSRDTTQSFNEVLRNSISQTASSYRDLNATVINTVSESQQFATTTEVVANHNHCHALTMLYFEVLRHYAIYQELAQVEECIFVPLLMTNFTNQNIYKWRDILAANLLPMPSETYLSSLNGQPLLRAFDANERIKNKYKDIDFPSGSYDEEEIRYFHGNMDVRVNFPRPQTRFDMIKSWPIVQIISIETWWFGLFRDISIRNQAMPVQADYISIDAGFEKVQPAQSIRVKIFNDNFFASDSGDDQNAWRAYAALLGYKDDVFKFLTFYFKDALISEWDDIYYKKIAPKVYEKMVQTLYFKFNTLDGQGSNIINFQKSTLSNYGGGEQFIRINLSAITSSSNPKPTRKSIGNLFCSVIGNLFHDFFPNLAPAILNSSFMKFFVENMNIYYSTQHYNGTLFTGYVGDDLISDGTYLFTPENNEEQRNPKKEDNYLVNRLIDHLNSNLEYYNKVLWYNLDQDRRYLLLDGFNIEVYDDQLSNVVNKSLSSVVKNELIGVAGNSLIFPVAAGVRLDRRNIIIKTVNDEKSQSSLNLFEHYKPLTPYAPYRISVPTRGVFVEAVKGSCDSCEKVEDNTSQDWEKFKTDEPTTINPVTVPTPAVTDWKAAFKDFATPMINIQNAPAAPAPGAGLAGLSDLLGKSGIFKDVTGLDANQQNAIKTYLSNQENAKAFGEMAKTMAMQEHNTQNADKIQGAINSAKDSGAISKDEANKLTKDHIQQMVDGGETNKINAEKDKPSLTNAGIKAIESGQSVEATNIDTHKGINETLKVSGTPPSVSSVNSLPGIYLKLPIKGNPNSFKRFESFSDDIGFGMFDNAFQSSNTVTKPYDPVTNGLKNDFIDSDSRRFYIEIVDPNVDKTITTIKAFWYTTFPEGNNYDLTQNAQITLFRDTDPSKPNTFVSKSLILVHEEIDLKIVVDGKKTGDADFRIRLAGMFSNVNVDYGTWILTHPIFRKKALRKIPIHIFTLKDGSSNPIATPQEVCEAIAKAQDVYDCYGILFDATADYNFNGNSLNQSTTTVKQRGIDYKINEIKLPASIDITKINDADIFQIGNLIPPNPNQIRIFIIDKFDHPSFDVDTLAISCNKSYAFDKSRNLVNCLFIEKRNTGNGFPYTVAHELGHLLMDKFDYLKNTPGSIFPSEADKTYVNHHHSNNAQYPQERNLMNPATCPQISVFSSKRIWNIKDAEGYNQFEDLMNDRMKLMI